MDPTNLKLLLLDGEAYLRVIDEGIIFAYGGKWSLLLSTNTQNDLEITKLLLQHQNRDTVFNAGVLSTSLPLIQAGIANNTFKTHGSMTSEVLHFVDPEWQRFYEEAMEQIHYVNRPGPSASLTEMVLNGSSEGIYLSSNNDSRKFVEKGIPCADLIEFKIPHHAEEDLIIHVPGHLMRFSQNMGIDLYISTIRYNSNESIENLEDIVPWITGCSGQSWVLIKPVLTHQTMHSGRNFHTKESLACWGSVEFAKHCLLQSRGIYGSMSTLQMIFNEHIMSEYDLNIERKNLNLRKWYEENVPELFAIDILRYGGWKCNDIQTFIQSHYEEAWLYQARNIMESITQIINNLDHYNTEYAALNHVAQEKRYLENLFQMSNNDEIGAMLAWLNDEVGFVESYEVMA